MQIAEPVYIRSVDHPTAEDQKRSKPTHGVTAVGVFLLFGMMMASLAGTTLLWPGTLFDRIWALNPGAYTQLAPMGRIAGAAFLFLAAALAAAAGGWFLRRRWGWRLTVAIVATQLAGDLVNLIRGDFLRGAIGISLAGALLAYLLRRDLKRGFLP